MSFLEVVNKPVELRGPMISPPTIFKTEKSSLPPLKVNPKELASLLGKPHGLRALVSALIADSNTLPAQTAKALTCIVDKIPSQFMPDIAAAVVRGAAIQIYRNDHEVQSNTQFFEAATSFLKKSITNAQDNQSKRSCTMAYHALAAIAYHHQDFFTDTFITQILNPNTQKDKISPLNNYTNWIENNPIEARKTYYKTIYQEAKNMPEEVLKMALIEPETDLVGLILNKFNQHSKGEADLQGCLSSAIVAVLSRKPELIDELAPSAAELGSHTIAAVFSEHFTKYSPAASKTIIRMSESLPERVTPEGLVFLIEAVKDPQIKAADRREALKTIAVNFDKLGKEQAKRLVSELAYTLSNEDELDKVVSQLSAEMLVGILNKFPDINFDIDETLLFAIPNIVHLTYYSESEEKMLSILSKEVLSLLCNSQLDLADLALEIRETLGANFVKKIIHRHDVKPEETKKIIVDLLMANAISDAIPRIFEKAEQDSKMQHEFAGTELATYQLNSENQLLKLISWANDYVLTMYREANIHLSARLEPALQKAAKRYPEQFEQGNPIATFLQVLQNNSQRRATKLP